MNIHHLTLTDRQPRSRRVDGGAHIHDRLAAHALGALPADEADEFAHHLDDCTSCTEDLPGFAATSAMLAAGLVEEPSMALRGSVLTQIAHTRQLPPVVTVLPTARTQPARLRLAAAAAAVAIVGVGLATVPTFESFENPTGQVLTAAPLAFVEHSDEGPAVVLNFHNLPVDTDGVLVLWAIGPNGTTSLGQLDATDGAATVALDGTRAEATAWAVTVERHPGVATPTTSPVVTAPRRA